jgi:anhydro-N-acetylmuramic acid kinase
MAWRTTAAGLTAVGLMSGTSLDGVDAAIIASDGEAVFALGPAATVAYPAPFRSRLRRLLGRAPLPGDAPVIAELTDRHAECVEGLLRQGGLDASAIDVVGFHGQTVLHRPEAGETIQIGDAARLAARLGCRVVADFRSADVAAGGQGAPLVPLYHAALAGPLPKPVAILNIGGVANVTWIGGGEAADAPGARLLAFDAGPGNALIDDWLAARTGQPFDDGGRLAASGRCAEALVNRWLDHPFFARPAPKSLDRDAFAGVMADVAGLSAVDGAATLAAFTAGAAARALPLLPQVPRRWLVAGGGRHNRTLMAMLAAVLQVPVEPVEAAGWRGDSLEAEAFAYLAVRCLGGRPITLPSTTGAPRPLTGGRVFGSSRAA